MIIHSKEISVSNTNKPNLLTKVVSCFWIESSKSFLDQEFVQQRCQPPNRSDDNHFLTARVNDPVCVGLPPLIDMLTAAKSIGLQRALSIRKQALTAVIYNVRISGLEWIVYGYRTLWKLSTLGNLGRKIDQNVAFTILLIREYNKMSFLRINKHSPKWGTWE